MQTLELPTPPLGMHDGRPAALYRYEKALGSFASAPQRMAPYMVLLTAPDTPKTAATVRDELREAAPQVAMDRTTAQHITTVIAELFRKGASAYTHSDDNATEGFDNARRHVPDATCHAFAPVLGIAAAHYLTQHEQSRAIMPLGAIRYTLHGRRLACLQACHEEPITTAQVAQKTALPHAVALPYLDALRKEKLMDKHDAGKPFPKHRTAEAARGAVADITSQLHSLADPTYRRFMGKDVLRQIVDSPRLYGTLAEAALKGMMNARRKH